MYKRIYEDKTKIKSLGSTTRFLIGQSELYLKPFVAGLYLLMDRRLVATFSDAFMGILAHRNKDKCLVLSELGGFIAGFIHAASGTKRLSNLFLSSRWGADTLEKIHLERASAQVQNWTQEGHRVLGFLDDSTVEKPESWFSEGLCAVYSSKAARLTRIKRGYYKQPKGRICVPGFEWTGLMLGGLRLIPMLGLMKFWTKRGEHTDSQDNVFYKLIKQIKAN
jgi:hypothetical protein